jgi:F0F1-type ATP synthase membrane subunit b/b'
MNVIGAILFVSIIFTSCGGNSIESDAKKVADLLCKAQKLTEKAASGDASVSEESTKLANEAQTLQKQLKEKYSRL